MSYAPVESQPIVQRTSASFASMKTQRTPLVRPSPTSFRSYHSLVRCGRLAYHVISNFNSVRMSRYATRGVFTSLFYADAPPALAAVTAKPGSSPAKRYRHEDQKRCDRSETLHAAQKDSIAAAMKTIEQQALDLMEEKETVQ
jgi:hypothetical protein